jgi:predicted AlkP superfamily phosphohydrolase/phosphomutase
MESKYKIGDTVKINDLWFNEEDNRRFILEYINEKELMEFKQFHTITAVIQRLRKDGIEYSYDLSGRYRYITGFNGLSEEYLDKVEDFTISILGSSITLGSSKIKSDNPNAFKSGEWAYIIGVSQEEPEGLCVVVSYKDGVRDTIPFSDIAKGVYVLKP